MPRSLDALLSPKEVTTLRRVALGMTDPRTLATRDLDRLKQLFLIIVSRDHVELTTQGWKRYYALPRSRELADASQIGAMLENYIQKSDIH